MDGRGVTPRAGAGSFSATPGRESVFAGSHADGAEGTTSPERAWSDAGGDDVSEAFSTRSPSVGWGRPSLRPVGGEETAKNFKVVIRVRPPLPRELNGDRPFENTVKVDAVERTIVVSENLAAYEEGGAVASGTFASHAFTFDHVYDQHSNQKKVYEMTAKAVVESSLKGYNATIFAYGQTGTGKTYTMEGFNSAEERGIIPRAIEQIFTHIQSSVSPRMRFLVRASYLQIYNEVISDLLKPQFTNLIIREDKKRGVYVEGLSEWVVRSPAEIYDLMERGGAMRATGSTKMNEISSRSHAVFMIITEQSETTYLDDAGHELSDEEFHRLVKSRAHGDTGLKQLESNVRQSFKVGKLNLVDLAGSERVRLTGATGQRLEETKKINQSLSALGNVIAALTDSRGRQHIPYRDSKLTRILEDSLGGNCKTTMMAMISPALEAFLESLSTLKFANRAKNIKNEARVNEDLDQKSVLRRYEKELKTLREQLEERNRNVVDQRRLLELEEQRRRAEEDKMAAIRALEARSREFMREKQEKKRLEERISSLQGQVLSGGANLQDMPAFRNALKEHQERIRAEYETRLAELERERETIEEEKAQVDRYKQLLLKQRDIMILLTQRLNERDEQIVALQDELDAYDRHQRELEEKLDEKTAALIHLQRVTMEHNAASPVKNSELVEALGDWAGAPHHVRLRAASAAANGGAGAGLLAGILPEHLIATKQFRPFEDAANRGDATPVATAPLLSAADKIRELTKLLETARTERERLAREVEDVQAEKVSMEYLLREKLEKLVQSEIESRLAAYQRDGIALGGAVASEGGGPAGSSSAAYASMVAASNRQLQTDLTARSEELASVRSQCSALEEEVRSLRRKSMSQQAPSANGDSSTAVTLAVSAALSAANATVAAEGRDPASVQQLRDRLAVHVKERRAIHTIMEQKIKTLVDAIATATVTTAPAAGGGGSHPAPAQQLAREALALQRLVNASITALRNSEHEQQESVGAAVPAAVNPTSAPTPVVTPLGRSIAPPPQIPAYAGGGPSSVSFSAATTPASIDAMIQRRKDELARMRSGGLQQSDSGIAPLHSASASRPASAARARPGHG